MYTDHPNQSFGLPQKAIWQHGDWIFILNLNMEHVENYAFSPPGWDESYQYSAYQPQCPMGTP